MARSLRSSPRFITDSYQPQETDILVPVQAVGLKGMDIMTPLPYMAKDYGRLVENLVVRYNAYKSRDATAQLGSGATSRLLYASEVALTDGSRYLVRWREDGVDVFTGVDWEPAGGDAFSGSPDEPFAMTGWGDLIIFTGGNLQRLFALSFIAGVAEVTELLDSPIGVIHLTTFDSRVVAVLPSRVQWSVKFDHADWTGLGSGYEDLRSSPGGKSDQPTAVVPITDELAYMVRTGSIWQISVTGNFDAPFAFGRLFTFVGSKYPTSVVPIQRGLICLGEHQIWVITPDGFKDVAKPILTLLKVDDLFLRKIWAAFDAEFSEYRLSIPSEDSLTAHAILRYSLLTDGWSVDIYPFPVHSISYVQTNRPIPVDSLEGTVDDLEGAVDDLGSGPKINGAIYTVEMVDEVVIAIEDLPGLIGDLPGTIGSYIQQGQFVVVDDATLNADPLRDVSSTQLRAESGFRIESGDIRIDDPLQRKDIVELVLVYESRGVATIHFDYSVDGGLTWTSFSSVNVSATTRARPVNVDNYIDRDNIQFAAWTDASPDIQLIDLQVMTRQGARIVDAN